MSSTPALAAPSDVQTVVERFTQLSLRGLAAMYDPVQKLFCYTLERTEDGMVRKGFSHRYSMITLMGLHRLQGCGLDSPVDIATVWKQLLGNTAWVDNIGDLGLLLWMCAELAPERFAEIELRFDIQNALSYFHDARQARTMELAWFLTGISYGILKGATRLARARDLACDTYRELIRNQSDHGTFGHSAKHRSVAGMLRGQLGSFADQVYPIYAFARYSQAVGDANPLERALDVALNICEAQGRLGQWWWHYDSSTGEVAGKYPVFSVHQHGMAPMTLFTLGDAAKCDFTPWIYKGLEWIAKNEIGFDMEDSRENVIWRSLYRPDLTEYWNVAKAMLTKRGDTSSRDGLAVRFECRPYELGWFLYAFSK